MCAKNLHVAPRVGRETMRNGLQNLLIFLSLGLCALVAVQWHRENKLRQQLQAGVGDAQTRQEAMQQLQSSFHHAEEELKRLASLRSSLAATAESNRLEIAALKQQLAVARGEVERSAKLLEVFKSALQQANDNIQRQNEAMKKLADERTEAVMKFNELVEKYNSLVNQWNAQPTAGTNAPPKN